MQKRTKKMPATALVCADCGNPNTLVLGGKFWVYLKSTEETLGKTYPTRFCNNQGTR